MNREIMPIDIDPKRLNEAKSDRIVQNYQRIQEKRQAARDRRQELVGKVLTKRNIGAVMIAGALFTGAKLAYNAGQEKPICMGEQVEKVEYGSGVGLNHFKQNVEVTGGRLAYSEIPAAVYRGGELEKTSALLPGDEVHVPVSCEAQ